VVTTVALVALWEWSIPAFNVPDYLLPTPSSVFISLIYSGIPWIQHAFTTFSTAILGLFLGALSGLLLAIAMNLSKLFRRIAFPYVLSAQVIPKIAIAPMLFVVLGFTILPRITIALIITFFPMVINTSVGLNSATPEVFDVVKGLRATPLQILLKVRLPSALPHIFAGLKVSATLAVIGVIVSEFIYSNAGLGYMILSSQVHTDTAAIFASVFILTIVGFTLFSAIGILEKVLLPWHSGPRKARGIF